MKTIGLKKLKTADEKTFTTNLGIKIRRFMYKPLQVPLRLATDGQIILESIEVVDGRSIVRVEKDLSYLGLNKNEPYIFVSTHSFTEDMNSVLATLDRSAYLLMGSTDQLEHNPGIYAVRAWGMIYVNREDEFSRKNSIKKMARVLDAGTSVILFPEGGYNNTENKIVGELFNSPWILSEMTKAKVVPIASFREPGSKSMYITYGAPVDYTGYSKEECKSDLRDRLASLMYELWYHHASHLKRSDITPHSRMDFMEERKREYLKNSWSHDVWDEEIVEYYDPMNPTPEQVRATFDNVKITSQNAHIMGPILVKRLEDQKYNFKQYMKDTWDK